jgi:hypothetical protein
MKQDQVRQSSKVLFCLARGYPNKQIYKYTKLIIRNILARRALGTESNEWDYVIFHEGDFTNFQKKLITFFSLNKSIQYIDISEKFEIPDEFSNANCKFNVGYVLMCRFNFLHVWDLISNYSVAMRVDDDVFLTRFNAQMQGRTFDFALLSEESHQETNETLPLFLSTLGIGQSYNQKFPYTNFYITKTNFWQRDDVRKLLLTIGHEEIGFENRWGDLPIIGTVLNEYAGDKDVVLRQDISYYHASHRTFVYESSSVGGGIFFKGKIKEKLSRIYPR